MMAEYIKREAAIEAFNGAYQFFEDEKDVCRRIINSVSVADVVPVVHGRWSHLGGDEWCCTNCGEVIYTEGSWEKPDKKFCHECGAKMAKEG